MLPPPSTRSVVLATANPTRAELTAVDPGLAPIAPVRLRALLGRLSQHFPVRDLSKGGALAGEELRAAWAAYWDDYQADLGHLTEAEVEDALAQWRRKSDPPNEWFPRSGEILEVVRRRGVMDARFATARKKLAPPPAPEEPRRPPSPEVLQKINEMLTRLRARARAPGTSVTADEREDTLRVRVEDIAARRARMEVELAEFKARFEAGVPPTAEGPLSERDDGLAIPASLRRA